MLFLVILHYKMRGRPTQVWARPENCDPTRPLGWSWVFFRRAHGMLGSTQSQGTLFRGLLYTYRKVGVGTLNPKTELKTQIT
jgi:hypothetical protein